VCDRDSSTLTLIGIEGRVRGTGLLQGRQSGSFTENNEEREKKGVDRQSRGDLISEKKRQTELPGYYTSRISDHDESN